MTTLSVSQDLYASVRPSTYSAISWDWNTVPQARILRLLRAILQCPELASNIQHVTILSSLEHAYGEDWRDNLMARMEHFGIKISKASVMSWSSPNLLSTKPSSQRLRNGMRRSGKAIPMPLWPFFFPSYAIFNLFDLITLLSGSRGSLD